MKVIMILIMMMEGGWIAGTSAACQRVYNRAVLSAVKAALAAASLPDPILPF